MMGKDCERILSSITNIIDECNNGILSLIQSMNNPIEMEEYHIAGDVINETFQLSEQEINEVSSSYIQALLSLSALSLDVDKINTLANDSYFDIKSFNNSCGSPWTEINRLKNVMDKLHDVAKNLIKYQSQKSGLLGLLNLVMSCAIDAKWALITYNDYIQRGYDNKFNDKRPSITFKRSIGEESTGNLNQNFDENVNIEPESIDPF